MTVDEAFLAELRRGEVLPAAVLDDPDLRDGLVELLDDRREPGSPGT